MGLLRKLQTDKFTIDEFVVDSTDVVNKYLTLSKLPATAFVAVDIQGGTSQKSMIDFQVIGQTVSWAGLGLEVQIGIGDFVRITYT